MLICLPFNAKVGILFNTSSKKQLGRGMTQNKPCEPNKTEFSGYVLPSKCSKGTKKAPLRSRLQTLQNSSKTALGGVLEVENLENLIF